MFLDHEDLSSVEDDVASKQLLGYDRTTNARTRLCFTDHETAFELINRNKLWEIGYRVRLALVVRGLYQSVITAAETEIHRS